MYRSIGNITAVSGTCISEKEYRVLKSDVIVGVLKNYEDCLSDGYKFYCGEDRVNKVLKELAMGIMDEIDQMNCCVCIDDANYITTGVL